MWENLDVRIFKNPLPSLLQVPHPTLLSKQLTYMTHQLLNWRKEDSITKDVFEQ